MSPIERPYELVVFGATGFTGGLTAEYLARHAPADLRWAIAGRSMAKLQAVRARLCAVDAACERVGTIEADVGDPESLARMAAAGQLVLSTVGPFIDYGEPVVKACVEQGSDYLDSTGEPHFVQILLRRYHQAAEARGARLVPSCGFDSIPADLGVQFTVEQLPAGSPIEVAGYVSVKGTFSGGTERSAIKALSPPPEPLPPLLPDPGEGRRVTLQKARVARDPELQRWVGPLHTIDGSVVLRSAAALPRYGADFRYAHHAVHESLPVMLAAFVVFGGIALLARLSFVRALLLAMVKQSGQGPTPEQMAQGRFSLHFVGRCGERTVRTEVAGGDPGYGETSKMLGESALCLLRDRERLPEAAGVLTPAVAMGAVLRERLMRAGLSFRVLDPP